MPVGLLSTSKEHPWSRRKREDTCCESVSHFCLQNCCRRTMTANFFITVLAICAVLYVMFYFYLSRHIVIDNQFAGAVPVDVLQGKKEFEQVEIARTCSKTTSLCYKVVDSVVDDNPSVVRRELFTLGAGEWDSETGVLLKPPTKGDTFHQSDTRFWAVSHDSIISQYVSALAVSPFVFGPVPLVDDNAKRTFKVLLIGLGGGNLDMFWIALDRKDLNITVLELDEAVVSLAKEWFGVEESERRRTVVGDGIAFIKEEEGKGQHYDVIVIDACDLDKARPCPAQNFLKEDTLSAVHSLLSQDGVVVFNVLPLKEPRLETLDKATSPLRDHFPTCFSMSVQVETNAVVSCTKKSMTDSEQYMRFMRTRLTAAFRTLRLTDIVTDVERAKQ